MFLTVTLRVLQPTFTSHLAAPLLAAAGVYTGEFTPLALCGFVRAMGEADGNLDRIWTKVYDETKATGVEL